MRNSIYENGKQTVAEDPKVRVTEILAGLGGPAPVTAEELFPMVYDELRKLARGYLNRETPGHTLQPTALVHEAYLKLVDQTRADWKGKTHFFAVGAQVMRRVGAEVLDPERLLDLDAALEELGTIDEREARVVILRFFGGLTVEQAAAVIGVSKRTVENDWRHAQAWLRMRLGERQRP